VDRLTLLIFILAARDHMLSLVETALDLSQSGSFETDLNRSFMHMVVSVKDVNSVFVVA
jgi:hypothetical protein